VRGRAREATLPSRVHAHGARDRAARAREGQHPHRAALAGAGRALSGQVRLGREARMRARREPAARRARRKRLAGEPPQRHLARAAPPVGFAQHRARRAASRLRLRARLVQPQHRDVLAPAARTRGSLSPSAALVGENGSKGQEGGAAGLSSPMRARAEASTAAAACAGANARPAAIATRSAAAAASPASAATRASAARRAASAGASAAAAAASSVPAPASKPARPAAAACSAPSGAPPAGEGMGTARRHTRAPAPAPAPASISAAKRASAPRSATSIAPAPRTTAPATPSRASAACAPVGPQRTRRGGAGRGARARAEGQSTHRRRKEFAERGPARAAERAGGGRERAGARAREHHRRGVRAERRAHQRLHLRKVRARGRRRRRRRAARRQRLGRRAAAAQAGILRRHVRVALVHWSHSIVHWSHSIRLVLHHQPLRAAAARDALRGARGAREQRVALVLRAREAPREGRHTPPQLCGVRGGARGRGLLGRGIGACGGERAVGVEEMLFEAVAHHARRPLLLRARQQLRHISQHLARPQQLRPLLVHGARPAAPAAPAALLQRRLPARPPRPGQRTVPPGPRAGLRLGDAPRGVQCSRVCRKAAARGEARGAGRGARLRAGVEVAGHADEVLLVRGRRAAPRGGRVGRARERAREAPARRGPDL
jgi:hypothetical protein